MGESKDIRHAVEEELISDPLMDPTDITVENIKGDVALNGTVPSYPQYVEAATAARRVADVTNVHNHLEVDLQPGDYRHDATLTTSANGALAVSVAVPDGVAATAHDGNIKLTGTVDNSSQRAAAEAVVAGLTGVRNIKNNITIRDGADPIGTAILVQDALDRSALVADDSDVTVNTSGNKVILYGHVAISAERDAAVDAARAASGVSEVIDEIQVGGDPRELRPSTPDGDS